MLELLVQWKTKIDWLSNSDWSYNDDVYSFYENENGITQVYKDGSSETNKILSKNMISKNKKYKITFTLTTTNTGQFSGGMFFVVGDFASIYYDTPGTYTFITNLTTTNSFKIIDGIATSKWGLNDVYIEEIGYQSLDISGEEQILINRSVGDIRNIGTKSTSFTKEFILPGSSTNNNFFNYMFDINQDITFNINIKSKCIILSDNINIFEGFIQLTNIYKYDDKIQYKCVCYGGSLSFFEDISTLKLSNLDIDSDCQEEYNYINQITKINNRWDGYDAQKNYNDKIAYPLLDWGNNWNYQKMVGVSTDLFRGVFVGDLKPAIYAKYLLDKIHEEYGINYEGDIFNTQQFYNMAMPINKWEHYKGWELYDRNGNKKRKGMYSQYGIPPAGKYGPQIGEVQMQNNTRTIYFTNDTNITWDDSGVASRTTWNGELGVFNPPEGGYFKFVINFSIKTHAGATSPMELDVRVIDNRLTNTVLSRKSYFFNDSSIHTVQFETPDYIYIPKKNPTYTNYSGIRFSVLIKDTTGSVGSNWILTDCRWNSITATPKLEIAPSSIIKNMSELIPEMTQLEFIKSFINMFNLYVDYDFETNTILYKTFDEFYNGSTQDWTYKIDKDSEIDISLLSELQNKYLIFSHLQGDDKESVKYSSNNADKIYGQKKITIDNEFLSQSTTDISTVFNSSLFYNVGGFLKYIPVTALYNEDYEIGYDVGPRIIYIKRNDTGGLDTSYCLTSEFHEQFSQTIYYTCGTHIMNPRVINPVWASYFPTETDTQYDLNFDKAKGLYDTSYYGHTGNNLYNLYWLKYMNNILSKNGKMMIAYFRLTEEDYSSLSLRDFIYCENSYFYINKIIDFNPNGLTKVELIKINNQDVSFNDYSGEAPSYHSTPYISTIGTGNIIGEAINGLSIIGNNNVVGSYINGLIIYGSNNTVGSNTTNVLIDGNGVVVGNLTGLEPQISGETTISISNISVIGGQNITIPAGTSDIVVNNSSDITIASGVTNVSVSNTTNIVINQSNVTYINNIIINNGDLLDDMIIDGGEIEVDGVYNAYKFRNYHINDSGENDGDIYDINIWEIEDGGEI